MRYAVAWASTLLGRSRTSTNVVAAYKKALHLEAGFEETQENLNKLKAELATANKVVTIPTFSYPTEGVCSEDEVGIGRNMGVCS